MIPGRNGLDFSLSTKYNSADANLSDPAYSVAIETETTTETTYEFVNAVVRTYYYEWVRNPYTGIMELASSDVDIYDFDNYNDYVVFYFNYQCYTTDEHDVYYPGYGMTTGYEEQGCTVDELNYEPVTTTTTEVVSVEGTNYSCYNDYDISHSVDSYFEIRNNIGAGWSFGFDYIGIEETYPGIYSPKYFHFGNGMSYEITSEVILGTTHYYFTDKGLKDCTLYNDEGSFDTGISGGDNSSAYKLVYKNGTTEYFNGHGQLIGIVDRYGNTIKIGYMGYTRTTTPSQVITSGGQTLDFIWTDVGTQKLLEVKMGSQILQSYTLSRISGEIHLEWQLTSKTDRYGNITNFGYSKTGASANFFPASINADPATIYYNLLTNITYATGASTQYTYTAYNRELKSDSCEHVDGTYQYYRITKRCENGEYNVKTYSYDLGTYTDGKAESGTVTDPLGVRTVTTYDSDQLPTQQSIYNGQTLIKRISTSYASTKLPSTVTTETFDGTESVSMSERYLYDAQNKGDLTVYWSTRANNNFVTTNPATVLYTYDNTYHQLTSKTYYSDENTKIEELFTLSGDKKHAVTAITEVNDVVSAKTEYTYDAYGNVTKVRAFPNPTLTTGYIDADLTYSNGIFLTEKSAGGVVDSDGNLIAANGTSPAGVVKQSFTYDMYGNVLSTTDGNGNTTTMTYDAQNRPLIQTNPDNTTVTRSYNNANNTMSVTDETGVTLLYDYDPLGNLVSITDTQTQEVLVQYQYDYQGRLLCETNAQGYADYACKTYVYDALGRTIETTITDNAGTILSYETAMYTDLFDFGDGKKCSMVTSTLYTGGEPIVTYSIYNLYGDLIAAKNALNGAYYDTFTYDLLGRKTSEKTAQAAIDYPEIAYTAKWDYDFRGKVVKEYNYQRQLYHLCL